MRHSRLWGQHEEALDEAHKRADDVRSWIGELSVRDRKRLLNDLIHIDLCLGESLGGIYGREDAANRLCVLLMFEWARRHELNLGEASIILPEPRADVQGAMRELLLAGVEGTRPGAEGARP